MLAGRLEQRLQVAPLRLVGHREAGDPCEGPQLLDVREARVGMDAPQERDAEIGEGAGDRLVRLDHEHLDEGVGERVVLRLRIDDLSVLVEDQLELRKLQHELPVAHAALAEDLREPIGVAEHGDDFVGVVRLGLGVLAGDREVAVDHRLRLEVGEALA